MRKIALLFVITLTLGLVFPPNTNYAQQDIVSISANVGFDGRFRDNLWMPILVSVTNNGDSIDGRVIVRPERTDALTNTFSTPISISNGSRQTVLLYATLRNFAQNLTIEVQDDSGRIVSDITVPVRALAPRDRLHVVVTTATSSIIDLTNVRPAEQEAVQVNWFPVNIPSNIAGLQAIDTIVFSDVDSGELTTLQREAIFDWVNQGGHLIVTGGSNWQPGSAAFTDILPITPNGSEAITNISEIAVLAGDYTASFTEEYVVTLGRLRDDTTVLASASDGTPLITRRLQGYGTIDYIALDPSVAPLRNWNRLDDLWFTLASSKAIRPGWSYGLLNNSPGISAMEILPGITALPEALAMVAFLAIYIVVIGPLNYFILSRLNRLEFAWITIPISIGLFTSLAWATGFNLRGNDVILSRLSVVQSWPEAETAYAEQFIGLLAPRRNNYSLDVQDNRVLRPVIRTDQGNFFATTSSNVNIQQTNTFTADNFPVDASFVAGFTALGTVANPQISGRATLAYSDNGQFFTVRGSIRNDTEFVIDEPTIIARGMIIRLGEAIEPDEVRTFEQTQPIENLNSPSPGSPLEYAVGFTNTQVSRINRRGQRVISPFETANAILNADAYNTNFSNLQNTEASRQEFIRRNSFLNTFMVDQLNSTARGNQVYFSGWTDQAPTIEDLNGINWNPIDSTIYLVELESEFVQSVGDAVVYPDQFTWVSLERDGFLDATPNATSFFSEGTVSFRFTPLPENVLSEVDEMYLIFESAGGTTREMEINLWDWQEENWIPITLQQERTSIRNFERFIGPLNAVQVQIVRNTTSGSLSLNRLSIEQRGAL